MPRRIGVIGSSNMDLVTRVPRMPEPGETLAAHDFATSHGGKGANQAVAAARLGADVLFVTRVGDDAFGAELLRGFADAGIDTSHARIVPGQATGTATILVEPSGENRIMAAPGANAALTPETIDKDALRTCDLIVLQLEIPLATVHHVLDCAREAGVDVLLNPAPVQPDLGLDRAASAKFLVPNRSELSRLAGHPTETLAEVEAAARSLVARGVGTVIVTLGADGALITDADGARHVPAPRITPIDTTGAGDAFIGAFAERWVETGDVVAAVEQAVRYAADSTTRHGAQASYATRADFLRAHPPLRSGGGGPREAWWRGLPPPQR